MSSQLKVNSISDAAGANGNAITLATDGTCTAKVTNNLSNRNLIINGAMQINQRIATPGLGDFNVVTGNLYTLDRWLGVGDSSFDWDSARIKQVSDSPDEFSNSLRVEIGNTATPSGTHNGVIVQRVEAQNLQHLAYGTSSAKSCTLSFWVRSNKTGTYCVQIQQEDASKYLLYEYSISSANTWEKKTITFSGNTANAITSDNGNGLEIDFHLACGSSDHVSATTSWTSTGVTGNKYLATSNQVNLWDHADNVWYLTGVQLEVGSVATDFEHRSYTDEYNRCLRYFWLIALGSESAAGSGGSGLAPICTGSAYTSSLVFGVVPFPTRMRAAPSIYKRTAADYWDIVQNNGNTQADDVTLNRSSTTSVSLYFSSNLSVTANYSCHVRTYNSSARLGVDAEL